MLDDLGGLAGIVGRADVLGGLELPAGAGGLRAGDVLSEVAPVVPPGLPLAELLARLVACPWRLAVVADQGGHPLGVVSDRGLLEQWLGREKPQVLRALVAVLCGDASMGLHVAGTARNVARGELPTVAEDMPLVRLLAQLAEKGGKRLLVVDGEGRYAGLADRQTVLRHLAGQAG